MGLDKSFGEPDKIAGAVAENASVEKFVFKNESTLNDFYWDQILFYLVSAILGLSFLDLSVEFFRSSIIKCYIADTVATRDQVAYFNTYCYGSLPNSQYYLIFIIISALIIIAPHYLWTSYFGAYFNFFFGLAKRLNNLRDINTGEYSPYNFQLVKKLEHNFSLSSPWMFRWYKLKLLAQLGACTIVQAVNAFYLDAEDFEESFSCPTDTSLLNTTVWPLPEQLTCVYNSLTLLYFLRNTALGLVTVAIVVCIIGLVWCYTGHTTELGVKEIAAFCYISCLPPEEYPFLSTRMVLKGILCCSKKIQSSSDSTEGSSHNENSLCCPCHWSDLKQAMTTPPIYTDLDFLVTRLFYANYGYGQVFKDIQIQKELDENTGRNLLYLLDKHQMLKHVNTDEVSCCQPLNAY